MRNCTDAQDRLGLGGMDTGAEQRVTRRMGSTKEKNVTGLRHLRKNSVNQNPIPRKRGGACHGGKRQKRFIGGLLKGATKLLGGVAKPFLNMVGLGGGGGNSSPALQPQYQPPQPQYQPRQPQYLPQSNQGGYGGGGYGQMGPAYYKKGGRVRRKK